jgi:hypothetical protein
MLRCLTVYILSLSLVLLPAPAFAADKSIGGSDVVHAGGLACFSITPPKAGGQSCDALCAKRSAACVGLKFDGAINPGFGCADELDPLKGAFAVDDCRCCAVEHR